MHTFSSTGTPVLPTGFDRVRESITHDDELWLAILSRYWPAQNHMPGCVLFSSSFNQRWPDITWVFRRSNRYIPFQTDFDNFNLALVEYPMWNIHIAQWGATAELRFHFNWGQTIFNSLDLITLWIK